MGLEELRERMAAILADRTVSRDRKRIVYELGELLDGLESATSASTPRRSKEKAEFCISRLTELAREHGPLFFQEAFLLNFVGEAMVQAAYVSEAIFTFLRSGLYFYGLTWIDRNHRRSTLTFARAHADLVLEFTARPSMKKMLAEGARRLEAERPFCIVHQYTNALRKRAWADARTSSDACDVSISLAATDSETTETGRPVAAAPMAEAVRGAEAADRVALMLRLFAQELTTTQQRVYLMRHPLSRADGGVGRSEWTDDLRDLFDEWEQGAAGRVRWGDIASRLGTTEKTAKREYLRALLTLLSGSAQAVFGDRVPSSFVRRMIRTLRTIVQQRDLRIRDNAGRGLGKIVERWEIGLRFVLNQSRVATTMGDDSSAAENH